MQHPVAHFPLRLSVSVHLVHETSLGKVIAHRCGQLQWHGFSARGFLLTVGVFLTDMRPGLSLPVTHVPGKHASTGHPRKHFPSFPLSVSLVLVLSVRFPSVRMSDSLVVGDSRAQLSCSDAGGSPHPSLLILYFWTSMNLRTGVA